MDKLEKQHTSSLGNASSWSENAWWLWSQLLRYSFCTICTTGIERLTLTLHEQDRLSFHCWPTLHHLLCSSMGCMAFLRRERLGFTFVLLELPLFLQQGTNTYSTHGPLVTGMGHIPEDHPVVPWVASRERGNKMKALMVRDWSVNMGCYQVHSWCISTLPDGGTSRVKENR